MTAVTVWCFDESLGSAEMQQRVGIVADQDGVFTSASNTLGMSLLCSAAVAVGVDVEALRFHPYLDRLARRSMTDAEHQAWLTTADRNLAFTQHWTEVEAYLKATGEGISAGLRTRPPEFWTVVELDVGAHHCAAVAVAAEVATIEVHYVGAPDDEAEPVPTMTQRFVGSAVGTTLGASMIGLANVLQPHEKPEAPIVVEHSGGDGDPSMLLELDPDDPKRSRVVIRRPK